MKPEMLNRLNIAQALLRAPLRVTAARSQRFLPGWITPAEVIVTNRLLIIQEGSIDYTVENQTLRLESGTQFFVPAWCRRTWRVPKRGKACRLIWCEFYSGDIGVPALLCRRLPDSLRSERAALAEIGRLMAAPDDRAAMLKAEGELKACLARFWPDAHIEGEVSERGRPVHRVVAQAMNWLECHYAEPDALDAFYRTVELSPNHFRLLFKRETGETVQAVLMRLRLRRARYLVQATALPMKRVAGESGYSDPLYFSVQYRKFWGRPATEDRRAAGVA